MHELSIAQNIIQIVGDHVPDGQKSEVRAVRVKIGKLSNILCDSLLFGFEALTRDTSLENARLEIDQIPLTIRCRECGEESVLEDYAFSCPRCESTAIQVVSGNELMVSEIELND